MLFWYKGERWDGKSMELKNITTNDVSHSLLLYDFIDYQFMELGFIYAGY